jgi:hypothetical protein
METYDIEVGDEKAFKLLKNAIFAATVSEYLEFKIVMFILFCRAIWSSWRYITKARW